MAAQLDDAHVALLCLEKQPFFDDMFGNFLAQLKTKARVEEITTPAAATAAFVGSSGQSPPSIILAMDGGIARKDSSVLVAQAARFVERGGTLIFAGLFSGFCTPQEFKTLFFSLGLPWESGNYHRTTFALNSAAAHYVNLAVLPTAYSQKALHAKNVALENAIYLPTENSRIQSPVFGGISVGDLTQTPAALTDSGRGKVGYIGDVNNEEQTTAVVLAMCGLNL